MALLIAAVLLVAEPERLQAALERLRLLVLWLSE